MMGFEHQNSRLAASSLRLLGAISVALCLWPALGAPALADSPAIDVNPKALEAVARPAPPKPKKAEEPKGDKVAALPAASDAATEAAIAKFKDRHEQVLFTDGQDALSADALAMLSKLADELAGNNVRIQLSAYAGAKSDSLSEANREALKRALLVRDYLTGKGLAESRVIVRALGPAPSGPRDRVDIAFLTQ
jgi:outer membrane protein OmpA-like peptidoglycan-associated protein